MPHIEQLSPHVANLIAAGEVVERPASVVKELLENAIDAGATAVTVELKNGGMTYLRVSDDGCGIAPDELPIAFLRHATSKLRTAADLSSIGTLGFRGEALAAIASVSHLDIFSRQRGAESGATLHLDGGKAGTVESAGCPEGTSIIVRDLFYNTPARLKFMKQDRAEATAIAGLVSHIALSHPTISFKLLRDGKEELHTPGDGNRHSAIYAALGREFALSLVPVRALDGALAVEGFVTKPLAGRGTRGMQTFFVNGRFVKSQLMTAAVEEAYANRIMKGKFPGCVLDLTLPCDMVDVNVHPAKTVVKFVNEKQIFDLVYHAAMDALDRDGAPQGAAKPKEQGFYQTMSAEEFRAKNASGKATITVGSASSELRGRVSVADVVRRDASESERSAAPKTAYPFAQSAPKNVLTEAPVSSSTPKAATLYPFASPKTAKESEKATPKAAESFAENAAPTQQTFAPQPMQVEGGAHINETKPAAQEREQLTHTPPQTESAAQETLLPSEPEQTSFIPEEVIPWRIAGEVLDTYIVCEDAEKTVWLIDKHAAHERINFDRLKANTEPIMSQTLLTPIAAEFAPEEYNVLTEQFALLREFGFDCEEFGGNTILVRAVPTDIDSGDAAASLEDLAGRLLATHHADSASARDALLHTMACKAAIKGGWKSDTRELRVLVDRVQSGEIRFCPHGRPVAVKLTKYELEKMFKRA